MVRPGGKIALPGGNAICGCDSIIEGHFDMAIHKKILQWQVDNPTITWIVWGIIWLIVFCLLFKPSSTGLA